MGSGEWGVDRRVAKSPSHQPACFQMNTGFTLQGFPCSKFGNVEFEQGWIVVNAAEKDAKAGRIGRFHIPPFTLLPQETTRAAFSDLTRWGRLFLVVVLDFTSSLERQGGLDGN